MTGIGQLFRWHEYGIGRTCMYTCTYACGIELRHVLYLGVSDTIVCKFVSLKEARAIVNVPDGHVDGWYNSRRVDPKLTEGCYESKSKHIGLRMHAGQ